MKTVLTIAGSDSSGGAGIQADLKTFFARGVYGMSVITALTAQNTTGIQEIFNIPADFVARQIDSVMSDIGTQVWKTGMLTNKEIVETIIHKVNKYKIKCLIVDPVLIAKDGTKLFNIDGYDLFLKKLLPLAYIITPNILEAEILSGIKIKNLKDVKKAAYKIQLLGAKNVVIKGGHLKNLSFSIDTLFNGKDYSLFSSRRIMSKNTHGTGCTFSSVIAAELAKKKGIKNAVSIAKIYITEAIKAGKKLHFGNGIGPLDHFVLI